MNHELWMKEAIGQAKRAVAAGELPIGGVLVGGDTIIGRTQTRVKRMESAVAHGELTLLLEAKGQIYTAKRPLVVYTTLEPCLMCLGACMQCSVDTVVFGTYCAPDGSTPLTTCIQQAGQKLPSIVGPVLESECLELWRDWTHGSEHPAFNYVSQILARYGKRPGKV